MRIILDTNIVLSALLWGGTPHGLLATIGQRSDIELCSSTALLDELADVLTRPSATKRLALIDKTPHEMLIDYIEAVTLVEPDTVPRVVPGDVDDDQVIAAAVAAGADMIITGDRKHLLPLGSYQGIPIVHAAEALKRITTI